MCGPPCMQLLHCRRRGCAYCAGGCRYGLGDHQISHNSFWCEQVAWQSHSEEPAGIAKTLAAIRETVSAPTGQLLGWRSGLCWGRAPVCSSMWPHKQWSVLPYIDVVSNKQLLQCLAIKSPTGLHKLHRLSPPSPQTRQIDLGEVYSGLPRGLHRFALRSMVCYYGAHYEALVLVPEAGGACWLKFDDKSVSRVGDWQAVRRKCKAGRMQPSVLFYEALPLPS